MTDASVLPAHRHPAADEQPPPEGVRAQRDLAAGLARIHRRGTLAATERWALYGGGILVPLGALLVLAGWYGAAHTTRLFEEIPYLISGGMFGLGLIVVGAALYFGYWLTRVVSGQRQMLEILLRIEDRLDPGGRLGDAAARSTTRGVAGLVATPTGTMFHRADCPVVADRAAAELRSVRLPAPGMSACKICNPLD